MKKLFTLILICSVFGLISCKKKEDAETGPNADLKRAAVQNYANIVFASYTDALSGAQTLQAKINEFVAAPSADKYQACKDAWLAARIPYNQTEAYRFYDGPIDDASGPEGLMNAWPLDESYIDYIGSDPTTGIINNAATYPTISKEVLIELNQAGGEEFVSTGYHAIEFLLWGQDTLADGPGDRKYTDYTSSKSNYTRRAQYLQACADLLVENLEYLVDAWSPSIPNNYRSVFVSASIDQSLKKILQGVGFFSKGEMAGERMSVALDGQLQEDEHSCFSDNTTEDIRWWSNGIYNIYYGTYTTTAGFQIKGTSVYDVIKAYDNDMAGNLAKNITESVSKCYAIPAPFDQQILGGASSPGGAKIEAAIVSLKAQADKISEAATALGYGNITLQ